MESNGCSNNSGVDPNDVIIVPLRLINKKNNMKKIIISTAIAILTINVFYLMFAFILWELDVSKWDGSARFFLVIYILVLGGFTITFYLSNEHEKEKEAIKKNK